MDPIIIAVIAGACGLVCAGLMTHYVISQPQTIETLSGTEEYLWSLESDVESASLSAELSQPESEEAVPVAK